VRSITSRSTSGIRSAPTSSTLRSKASVAAA